MKLYAIADLHLDFAENRASLEALPAYPDDWLIVAGDVGTSEDHLRLALSLLTVRFARVIWVPGNHDLWTVGPHFLRGEAKYQALVTICREFDVLTPEDPYVRWPGEGSYLLAPLFLLYDYSFRPEGLSQEEALAWAHAAGVVFRDEKLLSPDPYESRVAWCHARYAWTKERLENAQEEGVSFILINHFPLQAYLPSFMRAPQMALWCGTKLTESWHQLFPTAAVVFGHLHMPGTYYRDGVRFEEVSLGYPRSQWQPARGLASHLREILPTPSDPQTLNMDMRWHRR